MRRAVYAIALALTAHGAVHAFVSPAVPSQLALRQAGTCGVVPGASPALRPSHRAVSMMAKGKKGGGGKEKKEKVAPGAAPAGEKAPKMKQENADIAGVDRKEIMKNLDEKFSKTVENTREALGAIRTGRPSPKLFDKVMVSAYGSESPLPQVASVGIKSASTIEINPFDKSTLKDIEKAIMSSDLNLTPSNDGNLIRINIPPLTTESRVQYAKQASALAEDGKVALRNIRRNALEAVKKLEKGDSPISEDESKQLQDEVQKKMDKCVKELDDLAKAKEKELNTV